MNDFLVVLIAYQNWEYTLESTMPPKGIVQDHARSLVSFYEAQQCVKDFNECAIKEPVGVWAVALHIRDRPRIGDEIILKVADILAN